MTNKTERLFNLIALLLSTRRPLPAHEIREKIPGYGEQSDDAFHRMFERDKTEIRDLGFALQDEDIDPLGGETGYRLRARDALLEDPGLTPAEMAALSLAAQAWAGAPEGALGMLKLSVASGTTGAGPGGWALPRVTVDVNVPKLVDAISRRKTVKFTYRTGGGGPPQVRTVDPYGLYHRGTWYLNGRDHGRGTDLHFKLSRIDGTVSITPGAGPDFELPARAPAAVMRGPWDGEGSLTARVAFSPKAAGWAERRTGASRGAERDDGWIELELSVADVASFAAWLAGFGDNAVAIEPAELREATTAHLRTCIEGTS